MSLDTYASRSPNGVILTFEHAAFFASVGLAPCPWIGGGSFRGKVCDELVFENTDVSPYQEWIPPEDVAEIATASEACDSEAVSPSVKHHRYSASAAEVRALRTLFRICADRGTGFVGSW